PRERDLRGGDGVRGVGDGGAVGVDLEVHVRPASGIAGREDAGEAHCAGAVGDLDTTQVVLVSGAVGVEGVATLTVAVPDVHGHAGERDAALGQVPDGQLQCHGYALCGAGGAAEARADVRAHDAGLVEGVRTVRTVARIRSGGLLRDLARRRGRRGRLR